MGGRPLREALLHPVRWRIVRAFFGRELTTAQLRELLGDVPPTTLYRHVGVLTEAGVLRVVAERRVRGAVERTYRLDASRQAVGDVDAAEMSGEEHRDAFQLLLARLSADFEAYLGRGAVDVVADQVTYHQTALYVTDEDLARLQQGFRELLSPYLTAPEEPDADRYRRLLLTTVLLPDEGPRPEG